MIKMFKAETKKQRIRNTLLLTLGIGLLGGVFAVLSYFGVGIPCIFHTLTGLCCPGCGNTRAALSLLRFDFAKAFSYNLIFPLEFFYLIWVYVLAAVRYIREGRFSYKPPFIAIDITLLVIVLLWAVIRNFLGL